MASEVGEAVPRRVDWHAGAEPADGACVVGGNGAYRVNRVAELSAEAGAEVVGAIGCDGKEQFVVLATAQGIFERRGGRNLRVFDLRTDIRGL